MKEAVKEQRKERKVDPVFLRISVYLCLCVSVSDDDDDDDDYIPVWRRERVRDGGTYVCTNVLQLLVVFFWFCSPLSFPLVLNWHGCRSG